MRGAAQSSHRRGVDGAPDGYPGLVLRGDGGEGRDADLPSLETLAAMRAASPVAHVDAVKAPVLVLLGAVDLRVPPTNGLRPPPRSGNGEGTVACAFSRRTRTGSSTRGRSSSRSSPSPRSSENTWARRCERERRQIRAKGRWGAGTGERGEDALPLFRDATRATRRGSPTEPPTATRLPILSVSAVHPSSRREYQLVDVVLHRGVSSAVISLAYAARIWTKRATRLPDAFRVNKR